ncbi:hypothetical protein F5Y16DRAFT_354691 [Xylariaceae sp. FL0255]|nr:hypothetical protein F5Y16DRAFT_354691 [Xylariaceae sp. FL0255]
MTHLPPTYPDGDEHNYGKGDIRKEDHYRLQNVAAYMRRGKNEAMNDMLAEDIEQESKERYKTDPTYRATIHGNQPSKGARIDAEIQQEEAEMIRKKQEKADRLVEDREQGKSEEAK